MFARCKHCKTLAAATFVALSTLEYALADGPIRSGVQRALGRGSSQNGTRNDAPSKRILDRNQGGFINRYFPENASPRRTVKSGGALPPNFSKSQILSKYGAATGGNWTSGGQTTPPKTTKQAGPTAPSDNVTATSDNVTVNKAATPTTVARPSSPPAVAANAPSTQGDPAPATAAGTGQTASAAGTGADQVDLVLEDVKLVARATDSAGPVYRIKLRNQGSRAAGKFRVGAFAEREDKLSDDTPHVVNEVAGLSAGKVSDVVMQLPSAVERNPGATAGEKMAFDHLLVIVDLDDAIVESEKSNNVADIKRVDLEAELK